MTLPQSAQPTSTTDLRLNFEAMLAGFDGSFAQEVAEFLKEDHPRHFAEHPDGPTRQGALWCPLRAYLRRCFGLLTVRRAPLERIL